MSERTFMGQRITEEVHDAFVHVFCHIDDFASAHNAIAYTVKRASLRALHPQAKVPKPLLVDEEGKDAHASSQDPAAQVDLADEIETFERTITEAQRRVFRQLLTGPTAREELGHVMGLSLRSIHRRVHELRADFIRFRSGGGGGGDYA